jgi:hypothetical protein
MIDQSRWTDILGFGIRPKSLGQDDNALSRDRMGLEEFAQDDLGFTVRVNVRGIECLISAYSF